MSSRPCFTRDFLWDLIPLCPSVLLLFCRKEKCFHIYKMKQLSVLKKTCHLLVVVMQEALQVGCKHRQRRHLPTSANSFWYQNNHRATTCIADAEAPGAWCGSRCRAPVTMGGRRTIPSLLEKRRGWHQL